jgi:hypothetical protein
MEERNGLQDTKRTEICWANTRESNSIQTTKRAPGDSADSDQTAKAVRVMSTEPE